MSTRDDNFAFRSEEEKDVRTTPCEEMSDTHGGGSIGGHDKLPKTGSAGEARRGGESLIGGGYEVPGDPRGGGGIGGND